MLASLALLAPLICSLPELPSCGGGVEDEIAFSYDGSAPKDIRPSEAAFLTASSLEQHGLRLCRPPPDAAAAMSEVRLRFDVAGYGTAVLVEGRTVGVSRFRTPISTEDTPPRALELVVAAALEETALRVFEVSPAPRSPAGLPPPSELSADSPISPRAATSGGLVNPFTISLIAAFVAGGALVPFAFALFAAWSSGVFAVTHSMVPGPIGALSSAYFPIGGGLVYYLTPPGALVGALLAAGGAFSVGTGLSDWGVGVGAAVGSVLGGLGGLGVGVASAAGIAASLPPLGPSLPIPRVMGTGFGAVVPRSNVEMLLPGMVLFSAPMWAAAGAAVGAGGGTLLGRLVVPAAGGKRATVTTSTSE